MRDRLSELFGKTTLKELIDSVGPDESVTIKVAQKEGIKVTRQRNITFWQTVFAISWFPILAAIITSVLWERDKNSVVIRYAADHVSVTASGLIAAWLLAFWLMIRLFRYVRDS